MTSDRLARIDTILQAALVRPPDAREPFVRDACGDDSTLCDEVLSLLAHAGSADGFLEPASTDTRRPLEPGQTLGPYTIAEWIGAGGMGEVYRARDPRLDRNVAIKILPRAVSADPERLRRFEQEARAAAALNHPNIVTLHDIGEHDGVHFLVLELIAGVTLAQRLERGPLSLNEVLVCGAEIASALDRAHRHGIVHRDLKPANVMLTMNGAKLLDFGLAKLRAAAGTGRSITREAEITSEGAIVGTVAYMSPEQAQGAPTDHRTDIFALGTMLYESATGVRPFQGATNLEVLSSILRDTPKPVTNLNAALPREFSRTVRRCLEKDPELRYQSARDVQHDLIDTKKVLESGEQQSFPAVAPRPRFRSVIAAAAVTAVVAGIGLVLWLSPKQSMPAIAPRSQLEVVPPAAVGGGQPGRLAISPDGRRLAFIARNGAGRDVLWVRALDDPTAQPLAGTEGALWLFWSPDSRFLAFTAGGKLKKIDASGGQARHLADATLFGGTWNRDDVILFRPTGQRLIYRVSANGGGTPAAVTALDEKAGETEHGLPFFLPNGRHFLYSAATRNGGRAAICLGSLDSMDRARLLENGGNAQYAKGFLLFLQEATLMARPFDADLRTFTGDPTPQAEQIATAKGAFGGGAYSVSDTHLVYQTGPGWVPPPLIWFDRKGTQTGMLEQGADGDLELSPDGTHAAVRISNLTSDIWVFNLARGGFTPFTTDPTNESMTAWSPDGRIAFSRSPRKGLLPGGDLFVKAANGVGPETVLLQDNVEKFPTSWSADGQFLLYTVAGGSPSNFDMWVLQLSGQHRSSVVRTRFDEWAGKFSRDGEWIAYVSNETGRPEVYVTPFPGPGGKVQVSLAGGDLPRWRADGKEIFYVAPGNKLTAAGVNAQGAKFEVVTRKPLFDLRPGGLRTRGRYYYDVKSDGQQFLVVTEREQPLTPITVVLNWAAGLKR